MSVKGNRLRVLLAATLFAAVLGCAFSLLAQLPTASETQTYRLVHVDAAAVGPQLSKMLGDYGAKADVMIDRAENRLIVRGPEASRQLAAQLIGTLDKQPATAVVPAQAEQRGVVKGYPVNATKIDTLTAELQQQFPASMGVRIAPDTRTSQLVIIAPTEVHTQIDAYLRRTPGALAGNVPPAASPVGTTDDYRLRNTTWREFEQSLKSLWGTALEIQTDESGETSLIRSAMDPASPPMLRVNHLTNEIAFLADVTTNRSWRQIALALDRSPSTSNTTTQLVPLHRADPAKIRETIGAIRDAALRANPGQALAAVPVGQGNQRRDASNLVSMILQPATQEGEAGGGAARRRLVGKVTHPSRARPAAKEARVNRVAARA